MLTAHENTILNFFLIFNKNNDKDFLLNLRFINTANSLFYYSFFHVSNDELCYSLNYFGLSTDVFFGQDFFLNPDSKNIPNYPRRLYTWLHD